MNVGAPPTCISPLTKVFPVGLPISTGFFWVLFWPQWPRSLEPVMWHYSCVRKRLWGTFAQNTVHYIELTVHVKSWMWFLMTGWSCVHIWMAFGGLLPSSSLVCRNGQCHKIGHVILWWMGSTTWILHSVTLLRSCGLPWLFQLQIPSGGMGGC